MSESEAQPTVVQALEGAAEAIDAVSPQIIAALGETALRPADIARLQAASRKIVDALTDISEAVTARPMVSPAESVPSVEPVFLAAVPRPTPRPAVVPSPESEEVVSLEDAEVIARLARFKAANTKTTVSIGEIARFLGEGRKLEPATYRVLRDALNSQEDARHTQKGYYVFTLPSEVASESVDDNATPGQESGALEADKEMHEDPTEEVTLQTEILESDEEEYIDDGSELVGLAARWMGRKTSFTMSEFRNHLLANNAVSPEEVKDNRIYTILNRLKPMIAAYYETRGERIVWPTDEEIRAGSGFDEEHISKRVRLHALGFLPQKNRGTFEVIPAPLPSKPLASGPVVRTGTPPKPKPVVVRSSPEAEPQPVRERDIAADDIVTVVAAVQQLGGALKAKQGSKQLAASLNISQPEVLRRLNAAVADGSLYKRGIDGYAGFSVEPAQATGPNATPVSQESEMERIGRDIENYVGTVDYVMNALVALRELTQGLSYDRLWKRAGGLKDTMDFEEFKAYVRRMKDDGFVVIPTNAKLSTTTARSKIIRGAKVMLPSSDARREWKTYRKRILNQVRDKSLEKFADSKSDI